MMYVKSVTILFFVVICILFSTVAKEEFYDGDNRGGILLQYIESGTLTDSYQKAEECDKEVCKKKKCNCCPGYGVQPGSLFSSDKCRKCDCGKEFSCGYNLYGTKTCFCDTGYTGVSGKCIADCKKNPCKNRGTCTVENNEVICVCKSPYTGKLCDKNKCSELKCLNKGECIIKAGKAVCNCTERYIGNLCQTDKCSLKKCQNGGTCNIESGKAVCICPDTHTGENCEKKCNCMNAKCSEISGKINCICYPEYGEYAEGDCRACNCGKGANCSFSGGGLWGMFEKKKTCICIKGFQETNGMCVDPDVYNPCHNEPCKNGARCEKNGVHPNCTCLPGYSGKFCEKDMCSIKNCQNGGTCKIEYGTAVCICPDTHTGETCEKKCNCTNGICTYISGKSKCICYPEYGEYTTGDCRACNCGKGANCSFSGAGVLGMFQKTKTCICPKGFQEIDGMCVDPDVYNPCENEPCKNGASCEKNGVQPKCICLPGYSGKFCEKDMCSIKNCQNGGTCIIEKGKAICICLDTYTGETCEKKCNCTNGICKEMSGITKCICYPEYGEYTTSYCRACNCGKGANCSFSGGGLFGMFEKTKTCLCPKGSQEANGMCVDPDVYNPCHNEPCKNGARCEKNGVHPNCICLPGYSGKFCEKDMCSIKNCQNGGICNIQNGKAVCICLDTYTGETCENKCNCTNGICTEISGKIKCICYPEYGEYTTGDCRECSCGKGANCSFSGGGLWGMFEKTKNCLCPKGFQEAEGMCVDPDVYNPCHIEPCKNGARCEKNGVQPSCICLHGFSGKFCEKDMCSIKNCQNGGTCNIQNGKAVCICLDNYTGETCEKKCNCTNGICSEISGKIKCICYPEYGEYTTGDCRACNCGKGANCSFSGGGFWGMFDKTKTCICPKGFQEAEGVCVDPDVYNPCHNEPCKNGARCEKNGVEPKCICLPGYSGKFCEKDMCSIKNCQNGGTCNIQNGIAVCICLDTYTGDTCEKKCNCTNGICTEVSGKIKCFCYPEYGEYATGDCRACNCGKGANCSFSGGGFWVMFDKTKTCICPKGFQEADGMCVDPDVYNPCHNEPCKNGAHCEKKGIQPKCICLPGYSGKFCEKGETSKCNSNSYCNHMCSIKNCQNGGTCKIENGIAVCICQDTYTGETCEKKCNCTNGICTEISGKINCICYPEYGEYAKGDCRACNCGKGANCSFSGDGLWAMFDKTKNCLCPKGFEEAGGMCVELTTEGMTNPEDTTIKTTIETLEKTTDLVIDNDVLATTETSENIISNETLITTRSFENITSDSTNKINSTKSLNFSSSTKPVEEATPTTGATTIITSVPKSAEIALISLSCIVVLLTLFSAYMVYIYKSRH